MTDFSVKKVSVPVRVLLLSSPQSDLCYEHALASLSIVPGKRGFHTSPNTLFPLQPDEKALISLRSAATAPRPHES